MAKTKDATTEIVKPGGAGAIATPLPAWLQGQQVKGMEEASQYVVFPRMKIVQKSAGEQVMAVAGTGDLLLVPDMRIVSRIARGPSGQPDKQGRPVLVTPIYFFVEWMTWNPIALKGQVPAIEYRTRDPRDPVVAKSRNRQLRLENVQDASGKAQLGPNGQPLTRRHVEHLNWIMVAHDAEGVPVTDPFVVGFSRAEHFTGTKFAGLVQQRSASPFHCVFEMVSTFRPGTGKGDWYGVDLRNPSDGVSPWVTEAQARAFEELYEKTRAADRDRAVRADTSDADEILQEQDADDHGAASAGYAAPAAAGRTM